MPRRDGIARARSLRASQTSPERLLWSKLRDRRLAGWKWRRQVPFAPYIADFYCIEAALVVELDGGQHSERADYDARRTAYLEQQGLRVIRFWNHQVLEDLDWVCGEIYAACGGAAPHPTLSPEGRGF
ncbi:MAG TPA: endonuclease domain-containing protein [Caulobacteraceae bacterium]|nr:endonuclease domain-containing protein [Caulobacteraceae bacterium]